MTADKDVYPHILVPGAPEAPLLFMFHGTGGDEKQLLPVAQAVLPGAGIVAPRGDVDERGFKRFFRRLGEGDYDMADLSRATEKMRTFVRAHIAEQKPRQVVGLGYSNGANILASAVFADPMLFDAAVLMHPLIPFEPHIDGGIVGTRILITAGEADPICPPDLTNRLLAYLTAAGASVQIAWHGGGHELRSDEIDAARHFLTA